ncbi:MAG TPA: DoxX-like family protein [Bryobacteraceae bacterium]|jgi:hypothetical protein
MPRDRGIYVEIPIRAGVDEVWRRTQSPDLHQQWDLRFTSIDYLPRGSDEEPQRFRYSTRLGFGLRIEGEGESTGTRDETLGRRTSALKFWSADPKSLIDEGSGFWQYIPTADGARFITWYDYRTRFGAVGRLVDRLLFRPLIGWATAWSFDRLRLWIERGVPPECSKRMAHIHALARLGIAFVWLWHGLVPKLLFANSDERAMMAAVGLRQDFVPVVGWIEIGLAVLTVGLWRWRPWFLLNVIAMIGAVIPVMLKSPGYVAGAFNPVTLNASVALLAAAGYISADQTPSAARCLRQASRKAP